MPVWHERTKEARAAGRLQVVGITQEQHPERCRLFAQWKGIDWPILWDPFNLTGAKAVPNFTFVDEHGVIRARRARPEQLDAFLAASFREPGDVPRPTKGPNDLVVEALGNEPVKAAWYALSRLLWDRASDPGESLRLLAAAAGAAKGADAAAWRFRLGVAYRLRHDSPYAEPGDLRQALEAWRRALDRRGDQYIWRRRLQQYGPKPDKPYPFYAWVERARADVEARGERPVALPTTLTATERNAWDEAAGEPVPPDPKGLVPPDAEGLAAVETAVAYDTSGRSRAARVYLVVRPATARASWHAEAEPVVTWVEAPAAAATGAGLPRRLVRAAPRSDDEDGSTRPLTFEIEVVAPAGALPLSGYVLYPLCRRADGVCLYLRQDFEVVVEPPEGR